MMSRHSNDTQKNVPGQFPVMQAFLSHIVLLRIYNVGENGSPLVVIEVMESPH
jgi:hypothetical protein